MNVRLARMVSALLPLLAAACSGGTDPGQLTGGRMHPGGSIDGTQPSDGGAALDTAAAPASTGTSTSDTTTPVGGADGGATSTGDAGSTTTTVVTNAFTGAGAYVSQLGPSTRQSGHNFPGNTPTDSPQNQACSSCHSFVAGGTVWSDAAGTMPAAGVEVRVRDAAGNAVSAWTDQDGNFYVTRSAAGALGFPVHVGVRNATTTKLMSSTIAAGTCAASSCHVAGGQGPIHLP